MSRHKLVKNLDLDNELDDYDGGETYEDDGTAGVDVDISAEDREQLRDGTIRVRNVLGPDVAVSDKEIQDSLWHYYYNVENTVMYILNQKTSSQAKKPKTKVEESVAKTDFGSERLWQHSVSQSTCARPFSLSDFFRDSPWLNIPNARRGEILVEPLYPRGGLLGGSSKTSGAPTSKLAALAAARKKKENDKHNDNAIKQPTTSAALLDKLSQRTHDEHVSKQGTASTPEKSIRENKAQEEKPTNQSRKYPVRRHKDSLPQAQIKSTPREPIVSLKDDMLPVVDITATPSPFAQTMIGPPRDSLTVPTQTPDLLAQKILHTLHMGGTESNPFAGPSPDDIVIAAQNSKGSKILKGAPQSTKDKVNGITSGINKATIDDAPTARSKNLDVLMEYEKSKRKKAANFVVIGHVDAGKSTLMGRLLLDLQVVDQRTIAKYRKEADRIGKSSFALAWVLDQGSEERSRGVTIDIATKKFETEETNFTLLDAPGHRDFIPNMIAGASQADFAVLVIDASIGSFESGLKGQTKEHALLVRSIGVQRIIVAINKLDAVSWSEDRYHEIEQQVSSFLTTAGFQAKNVSFVPCSGLTGDNIVHRIEDASASWYKGPVLVEQLEASEPVTRALKKPFRLTVNDIFRGGVQNPLSVSGRMDAGSVQVGDRILAMPSNESASIKGIEVDQHPSDWAVAGQNVILHLIDIDEKHLKPGDIICLPSSPIKVITTFTTKVLAFDHVTPMHVEVHRGRLQVPGRITQLMAVLDKGSGAVVKKKPRLIKPGDVARVMVELEDAVSLEAPGRVILRVGGATLAAGLLEET